MTGTRRRIGGTVVLIAMIGGLAGCTTQPAAAPAPAPKPSTKIAQSPTTRPPTTPPPSRPATTPKPPKSFGPDNTVTDIGIDTTGLALPKPVNGIRHGVLKVKVTNKGPSPVWRMVLSVEVPESFQAEGDGWAGCTKLRSTETGPGQRHRHTAADPPQGDRPALPG